MDKKAALWRIQEQWLSFIMRGATTEMEIAIAVQERRFDEVVDTTRRWLSALAELRRQQPRA